MREPQRTPFWLWMNLLGLDAPLVAVVWQGFVALCYPSVLRPAGRVMLGLTVWAIYLADRLLDLRSQSTDAGTLAHRFCRRNYKLAGSLLAFILVADVLVAFVWLRPAVFSNGLLVGAGVITYFGAFPVGGIAARWKPVAAAILFTTGVFLVAWTGTENPERTLGWPAVAFSLLCLTNLGLIRCWERQQRTVRAGIGILLLALVCAFYGVSHWYAAVALSAAGLAALAFRGDRLSHAARRVLADAVLLSPLVFLWTLAA
jgi:hypothetical protein